MFLTSNTMRSMNNMEKQLSRNDLYSNLETNNSPQDQDDLVNISGECHVEEDILSRSKPTVFKDLRRGGMDSSASQYNNTGSDISNMIKAHAESPCWNIAASRESNSVCYKDYSPPVE